MKLTFDVTNILNEKKINIIAWMKNWLDVLKKSIDEKTPEDTFELIKNNKINSPVVEWNIVIWSVSNNTEYAILVERGVQNKKYNYYKGWWRRKWWKPFYVWGSIGKWVWARMFTRWLDDSKQEIINKY